MDRDKTRPLFPWYKERLQTEFLKPQENMVSSVFSFVNMNLDDFSEGSAVLSGAPRGFSPVIFHGTQNQKSNQKLRKSTSKEWACFSKQTIQKQIRREYVAALEEKLTRHPLTTFPHYKDHMTPELFYEVASVLEPDMCVNDAPGLPPPTGRRKTEDDEESCQEPSEKEQ